MTKRPTRPALIGAALALAVLGCGPDPATNGRTVERRGFTSQELALHMARNGLCPQSTSNPSRLHCTYNINEGECIWLADVLVGDDGSLTVGYVSDASEFNRCVQGWRRRMRETVDLGRL